MLKIADGQSGLQVGLHGLLRRRDADTIYRWVKRYLAEGVAGLAVREGRGRKAAFPPRYPTAQRAQTALLQVVRRELQQFGYAECRWQLSSVLQSCPW